MAQRTIDVHSFFDQYDNGDNSEQDEGEDKCTSELADLIHTSAELLSHHPGYTCKWHVTVDRQAEVFGILYDAAVHVLSSRHLTEFVDHLK